LHWTTFLIGLAGIAIIVVFKKIKKSIPGALIAVVAGILIVTIGGLESQGVTIVGNVPGGLPSFGIPQLDVSTISSLIYVALAISLVSFMESIAVAKAIQAKHKDYEVIPNQELIALGLANMGGSFFQSFPTTGGFSRTAVNNDAGAKTGLASLISVALIVVTLLFFTPLFHNLPNAILAAVIMVAVFGLIDFKEAIHLWKTDKTDFILLLVTFLATATLGIEIGIAIGVILSISMLIFRTSRPHMAELGLVKGTNTYRNIDRFKDLEMIENTVIVRLDAQLFFANAGYVKDKLISYIENKKSKIKYLVLNAESISYVDSTGIHMLLELYKDLKNEGITFLFSGVIGPVRDTFEKSHLIDKIGEDHFFMNVRDAIDHTKGDNGHNQAYQKLAIQSNISD
jgi:SulP family sulfate permease